MDDFDFPTSLTCYSSLPIERLFHVFHLVFQNLQANWVFHIRWPFREPFESYDLVVRAHQKKSSQEVERYRRSIPKPVRQIEAKLRNCKTAWHLNNRFNTAPWIQFLQPVFRKASTFPDSAFVLSFSSSNKRSFKSGFRPLCIENRCVIFFFQSGCSHISIIFVMLPPLFAFDWF